MKKSRSQLKVENEKLKRENEKLAAGACQYVVGDDGGSAACRKLRYIYNVANKARCGERIPMEAINEILAAIPSDFRV